MNDDDVAEAAQAIIAHLPVLVGAEAEAVSTQLRELLARTPTGGEVTVDLLRVLAARASTREWVRALLDVPIAARAFEQLPGKHQPVRLPRYGCPHGDQDPWFRFDVRDVIPVCATHAVTYVRVP